jgi:hypothetical protein
MFARPRATSVVVRLTSVWAEMIDLFGLSEDPASPCSAS